MKRLLIASGTAVLLAFAAAPAFAQGMMGWNYGYVPSAASSAGTETAQILQEEADGKAILERLQAKQVRCGELSDEDFDKLGDYYMGLMMGADHEVMDRVMQARLGESGDTRMHVAMGKRLSGCDVNAAYPSQGYGLMPVIGSDGWGMMRPWTAGAYATPQADIGTWVTTGLIWVFLALGIFALAKWILKRK